VQRALRLPDVVICQEKLAMEVRAWPGVRRKGSANCWEDRQKAQSPEIAIDRMA